METKKSKVWKVAFYTAIIDIVIISACLFSFRNAQEAILEVALMMGALYLLQFFVGLIVAMPKKSRETGQGILLGTLLVLLVGFGLCSLFAF